MTTQTTEKPSTFTTREVPWMKLGKIIDGAVTAQEAAALTGMNFEVGLAPVQYEIDGVTHGYKERMVSYRKDTNVPLGVVSNTYEMVQYAEAFDFMNNIDPMFVAAGLLQGGKQGFMVVEHPDMKLNVLGGADSHDIFCVLRTSHDRTRGIEVMMMPLRGRCMNGLSLAMFGKGAKNRWSYKHTKNVHTKLAEAVDTLKQATAYAREYEALVERLVSIPVTHDWAYDVLVSHILPETSKKKEHVASQITAMMSGDDTIGSEFDNTGWGFVNAVSSYYEWERTGGTPTSRFLNGIQGQTNKAINRASALVLTRAA